MSKIIYTVTLRGRVSMDLAQRILQCTVASPTEIEENNGTMTVRWMQAIGGPACVVAKGEEALFHCLPAPVREKLEMSAVDLGQTPAPSQKKQPDMAVAGLEKQRQDLLNENKRLRDRIIELETQLEDKIDREEAMPNDVEKILKSPEFVLLKATAPTESGRLASKIREAFKGFEAVEEELETAKRTSDDLCTALNTADTRATDLHAKIAALGQSLEASRKSNEDLGLKLENREARVAELEAAIDKHNEEVRKKQASPVAASIDQLEAQRERLAIAIHGMAGGTSNQEIFGKLLFEQSIPPGYFKKDRLLDLYNQTFATPWARSADELLTLTIAAYNKQPPRQTKETTMADKNDAAPTTGQKILTTIKSDGTEAAWRTAGSQLVKLTRDPLAAVLQRHLGPDDEALRAKLGAFLQTDLGSAMLASLLSLGMSALPDTGNGVPQRMAKELRIKAMADMGDLTADVLMGPLRQVISMYLQDIEGLVSTPELPAAAGELADGATVSPIGVREKAKVK